MRLVREPVVNPEETAEEQIKKDIIEREKFKSGEVNPGLIKPIKDALYTEIKK